MWDRYFHPLGGDTKYWMRYLITWFMPIITIILMTLSIFTGFWFTAFSSINNYSSFILPFFGLTKPVIKLNIVDFPTPLGPSIPKI